MPSIMNNPIYNKRLQRWFSDRMDEQCQHIVDLPDGVGQIPVPTFEFNLVFQLSHMMHHYFDEGIGLRQMMDYYYLLRSIDNGQFGEDVTVSGTEEVCWSGDVCHATCVQLGRNVHDSTCGREKR